MIGNDIVQKIVSSDMMSVAIVDASLSVVEKHGNLLGWMPDIGASVCGGGMLVGYAETLLEMQRSDLDSLVLPAISHANPGEDELPREISIRILWDASTQRYAILTIEETATVGAWRQVVGDSRQVRLEREQYQAVLARVRNLEFMYQDIVDNSADMILRLDEAGKILFANAAASRILQWPPGVLLGTSVDAVLPAGSGAASWLQRLRQCRENTGAPVETEIEMTGEGGSTHWYACTIGWLGYEGVRQYQLIGRDVSDSKRLLLEERRANESALTAAAAQERMRIARDLHDTLVRSILSVLAQIRLVAKLIPRVDKRELGEELAIAEETAQTGITLARQAIFEMRMELSPEHPLGEMIDRLAKATARRVNISSKTVVAEGALWRFRWPSRSGLSYLRRSIAERGATLPGDVGRGERICRQRGFAAQPGRQDQG